MSRPMKDSGVEWIGEVPEAWSDVRISEVLSETTNKGHPSDRVLSASQSLGVVHQSKLPQRAMSSDENKRAGFKRVEIGQFVVSLRSFEGGIEYAWDSGIISPAYTVCRLDFGDSGYFRNLFKSENFINGLSIFMKGIRDGQSISFKFLKTIVVPYPTLAEQNLIATYLDNQTALIDKKIALIDRKIALLQEYRKAMIFEAVTKGLDRDAPMKDSGVEWIGETPEGWLTSHLKDISSVSVGKTPDTSNEKNFDGGLPWITIGDLSDSGIFPVETKKTISRAGAISCNIKPARAGSLLISFKLSVGKIAVAPVEVYTNEAIAAINGNGFSINAYLKFACPIAFLEEATENIYGAKILNQDGISRVRIPMPPLPEQHLIAAHLDNQTALIDKKVGLLRSKKDLLGEYRKALIFEAVTGKLDVTQL